MSVIVPAYNRAKLIRRSIQSILNQGYRDFELIVVDDASTDGTEEIVKGFQDPRIRYIRHDKNRGASAARNTGVKAAKGGFIAFQDSDDEWFPEKLEKQMKAFEAASPDVGIVYTGFWRLEGNKKIYTPSPFLKHKEGAIHKDLLKGSFVSTQTIVVRKECFKKAGLFDETLPRLQDWELVLRLSKHYKFKHIDEALLNAYFTPYSISASNKSHIKAFESIITKHFEDFNKNKKILAKHYFSIGIFLCIDGEFKKGRNYFLKAIKLNPTNISYLTIAFLSLLSKNIFNAVISIYWKAKNIANRVSMVISKKHSGFI